MRESTAAPQRAPITCLEDVTVCRIKGGSTQQKCNPALEAEMMSGPDTRAYEVGADAGAFAVVPLQTSPTSPTITFTDVLVIVIGEIRDFQRSWRLTRCAASGW
jgi:hypothetical protein